LRGLKLDPEVLADSSLRATILSVARSRGLSLTATGVEASGRLEELRELGFSAAQGNALAVDMEERELYGLLRRRS
jgi:EAL domain-containing protein (putative c-di-GMP-specific phosphodiesterase class I)